MTWILISATPSPYARKVRIALQEKGIPFTLQTEVPWDSTTKTPDHNPLEKLPILVLDDGKTAIYESHFILEWLEAKYPDPPLLPPASDVDDRLFAKQVEVVCDGVCDALVLAFFEKQREVQSEPWRARQMRKADGGLRQLNTWLEQSGSGKFLIHDRLSLADLAAGSMLGWMAIRWTDHPWRTQYPGLSKYYEGLETLQSFQDTRPSPQTMKDKIV
ncbi:glutathione S-transferase domain-containing protein [Teratosphaeria nubilosa]|uniref:Glutathione S-transferase domain-containing protein n=1 Tax=Teratosphaeria nubilosa TaxID=161662 RepID=A0A6G1L996_9PEZI|nr:glutathione S-transferase domain-containing protein [Teratosphaeria nubilosa]